MTPDPSTGAYGLRLAFPPDTPPFADLIPLRGSAPVVSVSWRMGPPAEDREEVGPDRVTLSNRQGSAFTVLRDPLRIDLQLHPEPPTEALVHPVLSIPLSVVARWRGDLTLHAGAFESAGGAWAVVGLREAGKSTLLAMLGARGVPVVADDLLTVNAGRVWSGPSCVDLRPDVAERFSSARYLGEVGGRPRHRLSTPPAQPDLPLRGLFVLEWADAGPVRVEPLPARAALTLVFAQEYIRLMGRTDPVAALEVASVPTWRVARPRSWEASEEAVDRVLALTRAQA